MDPKFLAQLAVIVELGSVTKAAQKLNVTQPTLSRTIKVIEDRVGGAVLLRGRYGVASTEIGERLAEEGRAILRSSDRARNAIQEFMHAMNGEIRVGVGPMIAATIMGDFFSSAIKTPPSYSLKIHCDVASRLTLRLKEDQLDVAIAPYDLNMTEDELHREKLFSDRLAIFVGKDDPLVGKSAVPPKMLAHYQWVTVGETSGLFDLNRETLDWLELSQVTPLIENTGDVTMTFRMLEKTRACSMLPFRTLVAHQERFRIAPVDLNVDLPTRNIGFWTTAAARNRLEVIDFFDRLQTYLSEIGLN